ncbi:MAG TPA: DUF456 domain-containing protein [Phycisphaerae bacterium]|nr:DUF456 domain-containing protein [Phycisphaerae bacterium]
MEYTLFAVLCLTALAGILLAALQLPGTWLILAAAIGYDWYHGWGAMGCKWLVGLAAAALAAEVIETGASYVIARKGGASRRASIGAVIGGLAGMILLSAPIPILGTILGGMAGCFLGALAGEMSVRQDFTAGTKVGVFATIGRLIGMMAKTSAALVIAGIVLVLAASAVW